MGFHQTKIFWGWRENLVIKGEKAFASSIFDKNLVSKYVYNIYKKPWNSIVATKEVNRYLLKDMEWPAHMWKGSQSQESSEECRLKSEWAIAAHGLNEYYKKGNNI